MYKYLTLATLATAVAAQPVHHLHDKRAMKYETVHKTVFVTAGADTPAPSPQQDQAPASSPAPAASSPAPQSSSAPQQNQAPAPTSSQGVPAGVANAALPNLGNLFSKGGNQPSSFVSVASSAAASSASSAASPSSSGSSGSGNQGGKGKGITYSPYGKSGCKSSDEVKSDMQKLQSYDVIRIYGTDCNQVDNVINALGDNQKVFLGIFDVGNIENECSNIKKSVEGTKRGWDVVHTVSIGNELVNGNQAKPSEVQGYTKKARSTLRGYGYKGPVVAVDTFIAIINNKELCSASDYIAANAHAYFDGNVDAGGAGDWTKQQVDRLKEACGSDKNVLITESGWPSSGDSNNKAVASKSDQKKALDSIKSKMDDIILFTAFNDDWKSPGYLNIEQSFGIVSGN